MTACDRFHTGETRRRVSPADQCDRCGRPRLEHGTARDRVYLAWTDEGSHPAHHRVWQARLRREWPVLANALDELVAEALRPPVLATCGERDREGDRAYSDPCVLERGHMSEHRDADGLEWVARGGYRP